MASRREGMETKKMEGGVGNTSQWSLKTYDDRYLVVGT